MDQYKNSGPKIEPALKENQTLERLIKNLESRIERQDQIIKELERDLRRLRNDMRMAISTVNTINTNHRPNG